MCCSWPPHSSWSCATCVALKEIWAVGEGFVKGDFGEYKYAKVDGEPPENCPYWTRKMESILENELSRVLGTLAKAEDIKDIAIGKAGEGRAQR